jgi:enamine deaminase RidA (YjgF/YER057c/UK114 family)
MAPDRVKVAFHSAAVPAHGSPIPTATLWGGLAFLSAIRPLDPTTGEVAAGDIIRQIRAAFDCLAVILGELGAGLPDVLKVTVYLRDLYGHREALNQVWAEVFGDDSPARVAVQVAALGHASGTDLIVLDAIAAVPTPPGAAS